ncbi:hypothetical protein DXG01_012590 [Tephrocybe rancida]|nr:hypothetical protein DXG01_012590 [Tephrocybe rancida]
MPAELLRQRVVLSPRRFRDYQDDYVPSSHVELPTCVTIPGLDDATLINHGHHFGRAVYAFGGILRLMNHGRYLSNLLTSQLGVANLNEVEQAVWKNYRPLLSMIPQMEAIHSGSSLLHMSKLIDKGMLAARLDNKRAIRDMIFSLLAVAFGDDAQGLEGLDKGDLGFNHPLTRSLLCPVDLNWDDQHTQEHIKAGIFKNQTWGWPSFVYVFGLLLDPEDMWEGLFRSSLLVAAYKHVFTSRPSIFAQIQLNGSTRPGDRCIHGMTHVTPRSIAYVAMQVRFALGSQRLFVLNDTLTSSRKFYESVIEFFDKSSDDIEMHELLVWWDQQVFLAIETAEELDGEWI